MKTFTPVAMHASLRILFTIVAIEDLEIHQMDVISAFLAGDVGEEIYIE
jgi:Reverse transcriptase (RNA-dependent DNA polymerase)